MKNKKVFELASMIVVLLFGLVVMTTFAFADESTLEGKAFGWHGDRGQSVVQLGPRPFYLVDKMSDGDLKDTLARCAAKIKKYRHSDFSIGHRGAGLQFPEHTTESYVAARRMGAGILECDVTFTKDAELEIGRAHV